MKRSRTCLNLVELDTTTASPKRTCSLPNLASSGSSSSFYINNTTAAALRQNRQDTLPFFHQYTAPSMCQGPPTGYQQPTTTTTTTTVVRAEVAFVVESIVRSQGSLSEITIHEGQQFIGEEVAAGAGGAEAAAAEPQSSRAGHHGGVSVSLFGGAVRGSLFEDEYSSDYFCGVASSDEAEDDSNSDSVAATATATTTAEAMARDFNVNGSVCCVRQISDADSTTSCARQVSDASSSSSGGGGGTGVGCTFEGETDDYVSGTDFVGCAQGSAASTDVAAAAAAPKSWGECSFGGGDYSAGGGSSGNGPGGVPISSGPHAGGSWRSPTGGGPRVTVRICSPPDDSNSNSRLRRTVPPPWPMSAVPHSSMMNTWQHHGHLHRRGRGGSDEEDGSLVFANRFAPSDDAKVLVEMARLRLVDAETASA
ncbi:unnamed protein product [Pylaiella littoralis]